MHYGEKKQLVYNGLEVVFYKHETKFKKYEYELTSIQYCKLIHPKLLKEFLDDPLSFGIKPKLKTLPEEKFYKVFLKQDENFRLYVDEVKDVTNDDEFNHLH
jgi:hypothetical protein